MVLGKSHLDGLRCRQHHSRHYQVVLQGKPYQVDNMRPKFRLHSHSNNPNITACTALWECFNKTVELNFTTNRAAFDMDALVQSAYTLGRDSAFKESATILKQAAQKVGNQI